MDYDDTSVPQSYDAGRAYTPSTLEFWLDVIAAITRRESFDDILDLGCGTGRYSARLAGRFKARVIALDPSSRMLAEAQRKGGEHVRFLIGTGEAIPLPNDSVDLVYMSMVFHHFDDPERVVRECRRVLRPSGIACLRAVVRDRIDDCPYVPFFPASRPLMTETLWTENAVTKGFSREGFGLAEHRIVLATLAESWSVYAEKIATRSDSFLARLSTREFEAGLTALRKHAGDPNTSGIVTEPVDVFAFRREPEVSRLSRPSK